MSVWGPAAVTTPQNPFAVTASATRLICWGRGCHAGALKAVVAPNVQMGKLRAKSRDATPKVTRLGFGLGGPCPAPGALPGTPPDIFASPGVPSPTRGLVAAPDGHTERGPSTRGGVTGP